MRHVVTTAVLMGLLLILQVSAVVAGPNNGYQPREYFSFFSSEVRDLYRTAPYQGFWQQPQLQNQLKQQLLEWYLAFPDSKLGHYKHWLEKNISPARKEQVYTEALLYLLTFKRATQLASYTDQMQLRFPHYRIRPGEHEMSKLRESIRNGALPELIDTLAPNHPWYPRYQAELKIQLNSMGISSSGDLVNRQNARSRKNWVSLLRPDHSPQSKLKQFQLQHGLKPDGIIGKRTRHWLDMSNMERAYILARNIRRLSFIPGEPNTPQILVNVPNYQLELWETGQLMLRSRTVVGKPARQTPMLTSYVTSVISNPAWNVPYKIMRRDILPKLRNEPAYLQQHGFRVIDSSVNYLADSLPLEQFNWQETDLRRFPYLLQQQPGRQNALGQVKFNMPNSERVYLHHTNAPGLFNRYQRALSSGCIRVERALELAEYLLKQQQEAWWQALDSGDTNSLKPDSYISVSTYYLTAWPQSNYEFAYRSDIYGYDPFPSQLLSDYQQLTAQTN